jgi:hypothetical protein
VGSYCVVEFIEAATDAFNALSLVALLGSSVLSVVLPLRTIVRCALSLSAIVCVCFFLFWWSNSLWHVWMSFFSGPQF